MTFSDGDVDGDEIRSVMLQRVDAGKGMWRFWSVDIWPDLFGGVLLVRRWGRLGTRGRGQVRVQHFESVSEARRVMTRLEQAKRKRGYRGGRPEAPERKGR